MKIIEIIIEETVNPITLEVYDGVPGDSAYIVAVKNGFEGTEQEWLDSLQGSGNTWGGINGTLSDQTDLQNTLNTKVDKVTGKSLILDSEISRLATVTNFDNSINVNALNQKVDKVTGYSLTKNDLTDALKLAYDNGLSALNSLLATGVRLITSGEINKLSNTSGTNTGDETTTTIKSKLGITTLSGSNTGDETNTTIISKIGFTPENSANKGANNGYAGLDSTGKVPSSQLPSYVDDVLEFANLASFPITGESGKIYIALDTNLEYRWSGSIYVNIAKGDVQSVNTKTGAVVLTTADISDSTGKRYQTDNQNTYNDATSSIQTQLNGKQPNLGFTAENVANKSTDVNADQSSSTKYPTVKSVFDWATGLFATKSMGAYAFRVNNTNALANATETNFRSQAEQSFSPTVTWGGTAAPSSMLNANYSWQLIGTVCTSRFNILYNSPGTVNTSAYFPLPSDMPTPYIPNGFSVASAILYIGVGNFNASLTANATASYKAYIRRNGTSNGFDVFVTGTGVNALVLNASITYLTA